VSPAFQLYLEFRISIATRSASNARSAFLL